MTVNDADVNNIDGLIFGDFFITSKCLQTGASMYSQYICTTNRDIFKLLIAQRYLVKYVIYKTKQSWRTFANPNLDANSSALSKSRAATDCRL